MALFRIGSNPGSNPPPPTFDDPVAVLASCHRKIEDRLAQLERASAALGSPEAMDVLGEVVRHFDTAGVKHTEDEEASIFPRLAGEGIDDLIESLEADHRAAEAIYLAVRTVIGRLAAAPELASELEDELVTHGRALAAAYRDHIRREEAELFPHLRKLEAAQLRAIGIEMRLRRGGDGI